MSLKENHLNISSHVKQKSCALSFIEQYFFHIMTSNESKLSQAFVYQSPILLFIAYTPTFINASILTCIFDITRHGSTRRADKNLNSTLFNNPYAFQKMLNTFKMFAVTFPNNLLRLFYKNANFIFCNYVSKVYQKILR